MTQIHRGQIFIRSGWKDGDAILHALIGIVETDAEMPEHIVQGYGAQRLDDGIILSATSYTSTSKEYEDHGGEIDDMITQSQWPRPSENAFAGGGLMFRQTRAPASPGKSIMMVAGLFSSDGSLFNDQTFVEIAGNHENMLAITNEQCAKHWETNGSNLSQVMKTPKWGWDDEPWGFNSTMSLKRIDEAMHVEALMAVPDVNPEQLRLARQKPGGWAPHSGKTGIGRDRQYERFKERMIAEHGPLAWDGVLTRSQTEQRDASARRIIKELMIL